MITEDFEIAQDIFNLISAGIVGQFEGFEYSTELFEGYMQETLLVAANGVESNNSETTFNGAVLYSLVKKLNANSMRRGENWKAFTMTYTKVGKSK